MAIKQLVLGASFRSFSLGLLTVAAASCVATGNVSQESSMIRIIDNPIQSHGTRLELTVYPYDVGSNQSYLLCYEPCDAFEASRSVSVLIPAIAGTYDGMVGGTPVAVSVEFDASCFSGSNTCSPHIRYIFRETNAGA